MSRKRTDCPGSETTPTPGAVRSIYGLCSECQMYLVIRRDGKLRKHYKYDHRRDTDNYHQIYVRRQLGVEPMPPERIDPDRRGDVEIIETTEDQDGQLIFDEVSDELKPSEVKRRELGISRKRWRINVVIEWWRST